MNANEIHEKLETAKQRKAAIDDERREANDTLGLQADAMRQCREQFNQLSKKRELQRLMVGKISPELKEDLVELARLGQKMEQNLVLLNQRLEDLRLENMVNDRKMMQLLDEYRILHEQIINN